MTDAPTPRHKALVTAPFRGEGLDTLRGLADVVLDPWIDHHPVRLLDGDKLAALVQEHGAGVAIYDLEGRARFRLTAPDGGLESVTLSRDGTWLAYGDAAGVTIVTRSDNRAVSLPVTLTTPLPPGQASPVSALAITPDGRLIVAGLGDGRILIASADGELLRTLNGHTAAITDLAVSADSQVVLSGSGSPDGSARLWRLDGTALAVFASGERVQGVQRVALGADLQGHSAGSIVVVPDFGNPRAWRLYGTLEDTLAAVDRLAGGRLDAEGCLAYFDQPCVP